MRENIFVSLLRALCALMRIESGIRDKHMAREFAARQTQKTACNLNQNWQRRNKNGEEKFLSII